MPQTISRETFDSGDTDTKLGIIFDTTSALHTKFDAQCKKCDERMNKLENNKKKNTIYASLSGLVGGFAAVMAKAAFWK